MQLGMAFAELEREHESGDASKFPVDIPPDWLEVVYKHLAHEKHRDEAARVAQRWYREYIDRRLRLH